MNVNGIDPNLQAQATKYLQSKDKVDHSKEELEVLWEYTKLTNEITLPADISDEDVLALFDTLDNAGNTAKVSTRLLLNAIKDGAVPKVESGTVDTPTVNPPTVEPPTVDTPSVNTPSTDTPAVDEDDDPASSLFPIPDDTTSDNVTDDNVVDNVTPTPPTDNTQDDTTVDNNTKDDVTTTPETEATGGAANNPDASMELKYVRILQNSSKTLEVNGQSITITNNSMAPNNVAYYFDGTNLVIEANDVIVTSNKGNATDNIKVLGNNNSIDMGEGDDGIEIEGEGNMIYGGAGNDFIKMRGNYNTADMSFDDDTVWMAGNYNIAHGQGGGDNFFAIGAKNTFYGQDGTDASYYNETEGVGNDFEIGKGHEFRVENKITDAKDFEDWAKRDDSDGPPYTNLPEALDGHEVRAYDDNTYTDKYEEEPMYYTEYRDIAYRELDAKTSYNNITGEGSVLKYNDDGSESQNITFNADGSAVVKQGDETINIAAGDLVYYDAQGNTVANPGNMQTILEKLATDQLTIGNAGGSIPTPDVPVTPDTPVVPDTPAVPDTPVTPDVPDTPVTPDVPVTPSVTLPTKDELATLSDGFVADLKEARDAARTEYFEKMTNVTDDGSVNFDDDAEAIATYNKKISTLNAKQAVVVKSGLPLIQSATDLYATDNAKFSALPDAIAKALEANKLYFDNTDPEKEDELKAEAEQANAELQELMS